MLLFNDKSEERLLTTVQLLEVLTTHCRIYAKRETKSIINTATLYLNHVDMYKCFEDDNGYCLDRYSTSWKDALINLVIIELNK